MSLYNILNGVNPAAFVFLPMLGKHPDEYPRFRDCFIGDNVHPQYEGHIIVYTRTGGGNREGYEAENQEMCDMPEYVADYDDDYDNTYANWVFRVPERWAADFEKILNGGIKDVSAEYKAEMYRVYPKLSDQFDTLFAEAKEETDA